MKERILTLISISVLGLFIAGCGDISDGRASGQPVDNNQLQQRVSRIIEETISGNDIILRCHAIECIAALKATKSQRAMVIEALADEDSTVRYAAAIATGDLKERAAIAKLNRMISDKSVSVRLAVAYALERMGDKRFARSYDKTLYCDNTQYSALSCVLLGKLGTKPPRMDSCRKLWKVYNNSQTDMKVRLQAAESLAKLGDKKVLRKLMVCAGSSYADDRMLAVSGLGYIKGADVAGAFSMLSVLLDDSQLEVQLAAIRASGRKVDPSYLKLARKSVYHNDPGGNISVTVRVRSLAILALGASGSDSDTSIIYKAMSDDSPLIRIVAARAAIDYISRTSAIRAW